jgi:hypothetical protein
VFIHQRLTHLWECLHRLNKVLEVHHDCNALSTPATSPALVASTRHGSGLHDLHAQMAAPRHHPTHCSFSDRKAISFTKQQTSLSLHLAALSAPAGASPHSHSHGTVRSQRAQAQEACSGEAAATDKDGHNTRTALTAIRSSSLTLGRFFHV